MIKRAVPLALALVSASNPRLQVLDVLSKFSHDSDAEVAHNAILAMGIVGAGMSLRPVTASIVPKIQYLTILYRIISACVNLDTCVCI